MAKKPAAKAPVKPPQKSAAPGTKDSSGNKKKREPKIDYPIPTDGEGKVQRLEAWPEDWDASKHKPIPKKHFNCLSIPMIAEADRLEEKAKNLRQKAEEAKKLGSVADQAKAKKLLAMKEKYEALKAQLAAQDVDVDALLAGSESED